MKIKSISSTETKTMSKTLHFRSNVLAGFTLDVGTVLGYARFVRGRDATLDTTSSNHEIRRTQISCLLRSHVPIYDSFYHFIFPSI